MGITSEIMIIAIVVTAVANPTLTPISTARIVTSVGKIIFAILLPIKIVVINSLGLLNNFASFPAFLFPCCASVCIFILFAAVKAVSLPEKKNEANKSMIIAIIISARLL